jgi:hypothetical protein
MRVTNSLELGGAIADFFTEIFFRYLLVSEQKFCHGTFRMPGRNANKISAQGHSFYEN